MEYKIEEATYVLVNLDELSRLKYKAHEYDRMNSARLVAKLTPEANKQWKELADNGRRVDAVKMLRSITGCGLTEAIRVIQNYTDHGVVNFSLMEKNDGHQ